MRRPLVLIGEGSPVGAAWVVGDVVPLPKEKLHHLTRVLRRGDGDEVAVTDGSGHLAAGVLAGSAVRLTAPVELVAAPSPAITVVHALPKGRGMDEIVRTLVELGVARIEPVITERTESRPTGDRAQAVGDRLRSVAISALEQAQSAHLCGVATPRALAVTEREQASGPQAPLRLVAHPAATTELGAALAGGDALSSVKLAVGPEGGFTDSELTSLQEAGWTPVRAGNSVLRTVHAGTVLVAAVLALTGGFGPVHGHNVP